jgi:protocatechuate 3,4-dioxygenase beta subunit
MHHDVSIDRRAALKVLGGTALAAVTAACSDSATTASSTSTSNATSTSAAATTASSPPTTSAGSSVCPLVPEIGDGPFYIDTRLDRRDITEGQDGTPLRMVITVVDTTKSCEPIEGVVVEVWQANALGEYSGYGGMEVPPGTAPPPHYLPADDLTFLRGQQATGADGVAEFESVYPSWYLGRTNHVHVHVYLDAKNVATTQLFFDQEISDTVFATEPYSEHTGQDTHNDTDPALQSVADQSLVMWSLEEEGDGYVGTITLGIAGSG